jgi:2'-5' RNA ligase
MSKSRMFFAAMPPEPVRQSIAGALAGHGVDRALSAALFAPSNWHQSLPEPVFEPTQARINDLLAVGAAVQAHACTLQYNRITSRPDGDGRIQVTLHAHGEPKAFTEPVAEVQRGLPAAGYGALQVDNKPHTTLSYDAPGLIDNVALEPMLRWTLDKLLLLVGYGKPYRYDILGRWPLLPERDPPPTQMGLF